MDLGDRQRRLSRAEGTDPLIVGIAEAAPSGRSPPFFSKCELGCNRVLPIKNQGEGCLKVRRIDDGSANETAAGSGSHSCLRSIRHGLARM